MSTIPAIDCLYSTETSSATLVSASPCGQPIEERVTVMNECGIEQVLLAPCKRWKCERHWICGEIQLDEVVYCVAGRPTRFAGLVAYNPYAIVESLQQVTEAIRDRDFRGVYIHTEGSDIALNDRRMYPLYSRCVELNVPLLIQVGASALRKFGPAAANEITSILVDFPDLRIVAGWHGIFNIMEGRESLQRHSNVSIAMDANVSPENQNKLTEFLMEFPERCMWGSNGLPWRPLLHRVRSFDLPSPVLTAFLHDNAIGVFNLARPWRETAAPRAERIIVAET